MKKIAVILVAIMMLMVFTTVAYADPSQRDFFPDLNNMGVYSAQPKTFDQYPLGNYMFDTMDLSIFESWATVLTAITNVLFTLHVYISYAILWLLMTSYKLNIFKELAGFVDGVIGALEQAIFQPAVQIGLVVTGIAILANLVLNRITTVYRMIISLVLVLAVAYIFFNSPSMVLNKINEISEGMSGEVLLQTAKVTSSNGGATADDAIVNLGNTYWETAVKRPWQLVQFGSIAEGEAQGDSFLKYAPGSQERQALANAEATSNNMFAVGGSVERLAMVLLLLILLLIMNACVALLGGLATLFQFGSLISAILGVIVFALALLPNFSFRSVEKWFFRTSGFMLFKVGVSVLISIYFASSVAIYKLSGMYGWFFVTILQVILILAIVIFRNEIIQSIVDVPKGDGRLISRIEREKAPFKEIVGNVAGITMGLSGAKNLYDGFVNMKNQREDRKLTEKFTPMANDYLTQKYNREKNEAEHKARSEGRNVSKSDYTDFVRKVDFRVGKGFSAFEEKDVNKTVDYMKSLHRQGEDPKYLLATDVDGKQDGTIQYRQEEMEKDMEGTQTYFGVQADKNRQKIDQNVFGNENSAYYDKDTAKAAAAEEKRKQKEYTKNPDLNIPEKTPISKVKLSSGGGSLLEEIKKDKAENEYREARKNHVQSQETRSNSKIIKPEFGGKQSETKDIRSESNASRKVANKNSYTRPTGSEAVKNENQINERTTERVDRSVTEVQTERENRTNNRVQNVNNEVVKKENVVKEVQNVVNKQETTIQNIQNIRIEMEDVHQTEIVKKEEKREKVQDRKTHTENRKTRLESLGNKLDGIKKDEKEKK